MTKRTWQDSNYRRRYLTDEQISNQAIAAGDFSATKQPAVYLHRTLPRGRGESASTTLGCQTPEMIEVISKYRKQLKEQQAAQQVAQQEPPARDGRSVTTTHAVAGKP